MVVATVTVFIVSLLIGALAIYIGASIVVGVSNYTYAIVTALIAAIVWAVLGLLIGWIPLIGPLVVLIAYIGVINWRYPGGWLRAALIALIAWIAAGIVLFILGVVGLIPFEATGVPGT